MASRFLASLRRAFPLRAQLSRAGRGDTVPMPETKGRVAGDATASANLDAIEALTARMRSPFRALRRGNLNLLERLEPAAPVQKA
jgi:hypothetical protein